MVTGGWCFSFVNYADENKNTTDALPSVLSRKEPITSEELEGLLGTLRLMPILQMESPRPKEQQGLAANHPATPSPDLDLSPPQRAASGPQVSSLPESLLPGQLGPRRSRLGLGAFGRSGGRCSQGGYLLLPSLSLSPPESLSTVSNEKGDTATNRYSQSALPVSWRLDARVEKRHSAAGESITLKTQGQAGSAPFQQRPLRQPFGLAGHLVHSVHIRVLLLQLNLENPLSRDAEWAKGRSE